MGGNATIGALKKNPDMFGSAMILCALLLLRVFMDLPVSFLCLTGRLLEMPVLSLGQGFAIFAVGVGLGVVGYFSALKQASSIVANGIVEMSNGQDVFGKTLILGVFPELYAILFLAAAFLAIPA